MHYDTGNLQGVMVAGWNYVQNHYCTPEDLWTSVNLCVQVMHLWWYTAHSVLECVYNVSISKGIIHQPKRNTFTKP